MTLLRGLSLAVALAAVVPTAQAQPTPPPAPTPPADPPADPPAKLRAAAISAAAKAQWKNGNREVALGLFQDAYREWPSSGALYNLAQAQRGLGRLVEAADNFRRFLDDPTHEASRDQLATTALAELTAQLGVITFEVTTATSAPVQLAFDGEPWRDLPAQRAVFVLPGTHVVTARGGGVTRIVETTVEVAAGGSVALAVSLVDEPPAMPMPPLPEPIVERPEPAPTAPAAQPGRFGALVGVSFAPAAPGAAGLVAVTYAARPRVQLDLGGLLGGNNAVFVSATGALSRGALRPTVSLGGLVAFHSWSGTDHGSFGMVDRTLVGVRAGAGIEWWSSPRLGVLATAAAEYYPTGEPDIHPLIFTPTLGVRGRL